MHHQEWTLHEAPLGGTATRSANYTGPAQDEALSRLLFTIEQHRPNGLLFGPQGSGKTLLLDRLARIVRRSARELAMVDVRGRDADETLWELCGELGIGPKFSDNGFVLWRRIQDHFLANRAADFPVVVILDHADQGADETDVLISRLVHLARQRRGLTLILAVRASHLSELPGTLREATDLRVELRWFDRQQTSKFIEAVFQSADGGAPYFEESAIERLYAISRGSPRVLMHLCDLSVLSALANDEATVTEHAVLTAAADLQIQGSVSPVSESVYHDFDD
jgi:general secretion pathway protein A